MTLDEQVEALIFQVALGHRDEQPVRREVIALVCESIAGAIEVERDKLTQLMATQPQHRDGYGFQVLALTRAAEIAREGAS